VGRRKSKPSSRRRASSEIDLHGKTKAEAIEILEGFISRAIINDTSPITIIHGIGSGAVKNTVLEYLGNSKHIASYSVSAYNPGQTIAWLE